MVLFLVLFRLSILLREATELNIPFGAVFLS